MDYKETLDWLFSRLPMFSRIGAAAYKPGLENVERLDSFFSHPHRNYKTIHVAGTNGKGSVSNMLASILMEDGKKVGLYTSPHLVDFRERIRVNGEMISKDGVIDFVERFRRSDFEGNPSFFELTMMMAFDWFARCEVDYAVIEVGMGGRLDSTNIISPILSIITNISPDHKQFLGETLELIATEKAGIIKPGIPVVVGRAEGAVEEVFRKKALEEEAPLIEAFLCPEVESNLLRGKDRIFNTKSFGIVESPLTGAYQIENCNTVLVASDILLKLGVLKEKSSVIKGMRNVENNTEFKGRWTLISDSPYCVADTGHNIDGLSSNISQIIQQMESGKYENLRMILGFVSDKEIDAILKIMPKNAKYYLTNAKIPRAMPVDELSEKFKKAELDVVCINRDVKSCYLQALEDSSEKDYLYVGGSTFVVADFLE